MLEGKQILVFAATGAIASQVARKFAQEGATVWLSARNGEAVDQVVQEITSAGGTASAEVVDATDEAAITAYVDKVAAQAGRIDAVFNGIGGLPTALGYPEVSLTTSFDHFMLPLQVVLGSQFLTARAAGAHMTRQGSGSIITLSATLSVMTAPFMAGISAACAAIEGMTRSLAGEFGPYGVRVNCVRGGAMLETRTIQETGAGYQRLNQRPEMMMVVPPLGRPITVAETAATAAFLASDAASGMTGQVVTVSAGAFVGL